MLLPTKTFVIVSLFLLGTSCASIVSKSIYPVTIDSEPRGANVVIYNRRGLEVFKGGTPALVKLKPGAGFFQRAIYNIEISKDGYSTKKVEVTATLNGWYFGNLLFGGLIGFLIVDPATGAMYRLNDTAVYETLTAAKQTAAVSQQEHQLKIYNINDIPEAWKNKLEAIQ
jgi:hypothetical protein